MNPRKLELDPMPAGLVASLPKTHKGLWKKIRDAKFSSGSLQCEVCGTEKEGRTQLDGHELWDSRSEAIVLTRIIFICKLCHDAIHLERLRGRKPSALYLKAVEIHYCEQNGITLDELKQDYAAMKKRSSEIFQLYKGVPPRMDYGQYEAEAQAAELKKHESERDNDNFEQYPDHECPWDVGHAD